MNETAENTASNSGRYALLSNAQMYEIDDKAIEAGVSGIDLMERAGRAVADAILARAHPGNALVLCGHGNNGGDGFVIARHLRDRGWNVRIALLGDKSEITGDAVMMAGKWEADFEPLTAECIGGEFASDTASDIDVIVDALLGAGLTRPVEGLLAEVIERVNAHPAFTVSVDIPSGISGNSGQIMGQAISADLTVTFYHKKKGHALAPGRFCCGELIVADIRIPKRLLDEIQPELYENSPGLWIDAIEGPSPVAHKYDRGHLLVVGGGVGKSGAARLAARAGLRSGAGLVTTACPKAALMEYASHQTAVMNGAFSDHDEFVALLGQKKVLAVVIGPNNGIGDDTKARVLAALASDLAVVLDADALTSFEGDADALFQATKARGESRGEGRGAATVLTPHGGEFARLFPDIDIAADKVAAANEAAKRSGAAVVLKGPDTVIADGKSVAIANAHASPWLATAGAGDVLSGIIGGLLAQGIAAREASAAATWLLGEASLQLGRGLIAEDLVETIPEALAVLGEAAAEEAREFEEEASASAPNETIKALLANS